MYQEKTIPEEGEYPDVSDEETWNRIWTECQTIALLSKSQSQQQQDSPPKIPETHTQAQPIAGIGSRTRTRTSDDLNEEKNEKHVSGSEVSNRKGNDDSTDRLQFNYQPRRPFDDIVKHAQAMMDYRPPKLEVDGAAMGKTVKDVARAAVAYGSRNFRMPKSGLGILKPV